MPTGRFARTTLLPFPLLVAVLAGGAAIGWALLEVTGSTPVAAAVALVVTWGGVGAARRLWAARGRTESWKELPSVDAGETGLGWRALGGRLVPLMAFLAAFLVAASVLSALGVDGPALAGLEPSDWFAFVLAAPVWLEVDARMGARAARKRAEEGERLLAASAPAAAGGRETTRDEWRSRARAARLDRRRAAGETVQLPAGSRRGWALALGILAGGVAGGGFIAIDEASSGWERVLGVGVAAGAVWLGGTLVRMLATAPFFLRLTPAGIDLMGAGEVPWEDVSSVEIGADAGLKVLRVMLEPEVPRAEPWYTDGHRRLSRRLGDSGLSAALLFSSAPAEEVLGYIRGRSDLPVEVDLRG